MITRKTSSHSKSGKTNVKAKPLQRMVEEKNTPESVASTTAATGKLKRYSSEESTGEEQRFRLQVERFIEISKYFSSPLRKTATYICETNLVSYPSFLRIEVERCGVTTHNIKFSNLTLGPVFVRLFKITPDLEQIKFINLTLSRSKRIPPGLSFNLGFVFDDVNDKEVTHAKMIFVASRKSMTPCYQVCEIELEIEPSKARSFQ